MKIWFWVLFFTFKTLFPMEEALQMLYENHCEQHPNNELSVTRNAQQSKVQYPRQITWRYPDHYKQCAIPFTQNVNRNELQKKTKATRLAWSQWVNNMSLPYAVLKVLPKELQSHIAAFLIKDNPCAKNFENNLMADLLKSYGQVKKIALSGQFLMRLLDDNQLIIDDLKRGTHTQWMLDFLNNEEWKCMTCNKDICLVSTTERLWVVDIASKKMRELPFKALGDLLLLPNNKAFLCTLQYDGGPYKIDLTTGIKSFFLENQEGIIRPTTVKSMQISPNQRYMVLCLLKHWLKDKLVNSQIVFIWDLPTDTVVRKIEFNEFAFSACATITDELVIVVHNYDINVFNLKTVQEKYTLPLCSKTEGAEVQFVHVVGNKLFAGRQHFYHGGIEVWDLESKQRCNVWESLRSKNVKKNDYLDVVLCGDQFMLFSFGFKPVHREIFILDLKHAGSILKKLPFLMSYLLARVNDGKKYVQSHPEFIFSAGYLTDKTQGYDARVKVSYKDFIAALSKIFGNGFGKKIDEQLVGYLQEKPVTNGSEINQLPSEN